MIAGGSVGHSIQYGPQWHHSPGTSISLQAEAQVNDICMALVDNTGQRHQHRTWLPALGLWTQTWPLAAPGTQISIWPR